MDTALSKRLQTTFPISSSSVRIMKFSNEISDIIPSSSGELALSPSGGFMSNSSSRGQWVVGEVGGGEGARVGRRAPTARTSRSGMWAGIRHPVRALNSRSSVTQLTGGSRDLLSVPFRIKAPKGVARAHSYSSLASFSTPRFGSNLLLSRRVIFEVGLGGFI